MGTVWKRAGTEAAGVLVSLSVVSAVYWGGVVLLGSDTETTGRSDRFTVTTPTETTTAPAAPTTEAPQAAEVPAPAVEPAPVVTAPAPAPAPKINPAPQVNPDGSLPAGWLPPSVPGGPPTAPPEPLPPAPCLPGEGGERCAPNGG